MSKSLWSSDWIAMSKGPRVNIFENVCNHIGLKRIKVQICTYEWGLW